MSKVWLVTGSSRGLGLEIAKAALAAGHRVVATARKVADLAVLGASPQLLAVALDVTDATAARAAVARAVAAFGGLDVVVNNAGYANICSIEDTADSDFRTQLETNLFGVVNVTRAALPILRQQRRGHVIQMSSVSGRMGTAGFAAYNAGKFAVEGFSEALAMEAKPLGIHVTIVEPGSFRTDWGGSSMRIDPYHADYEPTVGAVVQANRRLPELVRGDPAKAARTIVDITALDAPPLRLLLGTDALFLGQLVADARATEDAKWNALGRTTDLDGQEDFATTPLAGMLRSMQG